MSAHAKPEFPIGASITVEQLTDSPYEVLAELRKHEPVTWVPALGAWWVTSRELAVEAMRDDKRFTVDDPRFTTGAILGKSMLTADGDEHVRLRSPFAPSFRPKIVREQFEDFLHDEVDRLLTECDVLGWYGSIADAIIDLTTSGRIDHADQQAVDQIRSHVMTSIDDDQASAVLQSVRESGALEAEELTSAALVIMFGAIETAEGMTTNALWHLFDEPERWRRVRNDRSLLGNAIDESLRLEPAASLVDRYATVDTTLGDVNISAGDLVSINLLAANRDPAFFDLPNEFDIQRSNAKQHVTFVQGPHACLGVHLTRLETAAALTGALDLIETPVIDRERTTPPAGLIFRKPDQLWASW